MIIDFSSHIMSRQVIKIQAKSKYFGVGRTSPWPLEFSDPEARLKIMDKYKIDMQVLSLSSGTIAGIGSEEAANFCRISNDDISTICEKYPDRFVGLATVSLLDVENAVYELDRAIRKLGLKGVMVPTNQNGKGLDSSDYAPFYEKVVQLDVPIFLHPTNWESYPLADMEAGWRMMLIYGWPFDTTQAIHRLIFSGTLEKYPSLKIVTHHLGAMLPFFARRLEIESLDIPVKLAKPLSEYFKMIYGDTSVEGSVSALACGYSFFGPDRIVFGTDYPFGPETGELRVRVSVNAVKSMDIPEADRTKIFEVNAKKLLKIR